MQLALLHGRSDPAQNLEDWGPDGPKLQDVIWVHGTYMTQINVAFTTLEAADAAATLTGWQKMDDNVLQLQLQDDLVVANGMFYGDWELQGEGYEK